MIFSYRFHHPQLKWQDNGYWLCYLLSFINHLSIIYHHSSIYLQTRVNITYKSLNLIVYYIKIIYFIFTKNLFIRQWTEMFHRNVPSKCSIDITNIPWWKEYVEDKYDLDKWYPNLFHYSCIHVFITAYSYTIKRWWDDVSFPVSTTLEFFSNKSLSQFPHGHSHCYPSPESLG